MPNTVLRRSRDTTNRVDLHSAQVHSHNLFPRQRPWEMLWKEKVAKGRSNVENGRFGRTAFFPHLPIHLYTEHLYMYMSSPTSFSSTELGAMPGTKGWSHIKRAKVLPKSSGRVPSSPAVKYLPETYFSLSLSLKCHH